jgi:hypothetical protein
MRKLLVILALALLGNSCFAGMLLIPMDEAQQNHIKSYGIAYWVLEQKLPIEWLLNYRGGSFLMENIPTIQAAKRLAEQRIDSVGRIRLSF